MAVAFDASSSGTGNPVTSVTFSHTCAASAVLCVQVGATTAVSGVTYNSVALTKVDDSGNDTARGAWYQTSWILLTPASGANNIVVSLPSGAVYASGQSYTGADRTTNPFTYAKNNNQSVAAGTAPTVTITGVTNGAIVGSGEGSAGGGYVTTGVSGGTERIHDADTNGGYGDIIGAGSGAYTVTGSGTNTAIVAMAMVLQPPVVKSAFIAFM